MAQGFGITPGEGAVDDCRTRHSAQCGDRRQCGFRDARQLALDKLAFDLEPDEHEKNRHQPVIDPQQQRLGNDEAADLDRQRQLQQLFVDCGERRVREQQRPHGGGAKNDAAGRLELEEPLEGTQCLIQIASRIRSDLAHPQSCKRIVFPWAFSPRT